MFSRALELAAKESVALIAHRDGAVEVDEFIVEPERQL